MPSKTKPALAHIVLIILVVTGLLAMVGVGYAVYKNQTADAVSDIDTTQQSGMANSNSPFGKMLGDRPVSTTSTETGTGQNELGTISLTADVKKTEDCGYAGCFEDKFAGCSESTLLAETPLGSVSYKIEGPAKGGCKVSMQYTANPNPEWVDKTMTCTMDNRLDFDTAATLSFEGVMADSVVCEGPLYGILTKL